MTGGLHSDNRCKENFLVYHSWKKTANDTPVRIQSQEVQIESATIEI